MILWGVDPALVQGPHDCASAVLSEIVAEAARQDARDRALEERLALLRACRLSRATITIPAGVVAEWWRGTHRPLLEIGVLEALTPELAQRAGDLLASTGGSNAVDATVVASAALRGDMVVTGGATDLRELAQFVEGVTVERLR